MDREEFVRITLAQVGNGITASITRQKADEKQRDKMYNDVSSSSITRIAEIVNGEKYAVSVMYSCTGWIAWKRRDDQGE